MLYIYSYIFKFVLIYRISNEIYLFILLVGLEKILPLKPVSFNMIASPERINFGFIAS